jgi:hypothetical protein
MSLYLNYACEHWIYEGENQPIGLILCSERNESVMPPISEAFVGLDGQRSCVHQAMERAMDRC